MPRASHLSKSRFVAGARCHKLLWWQVHEPEAPELQPDKVLQDRFDQGTHVGEVARTRFSGGVSIDLPRDEYERRIAATASALDGGAPCVFEACFRADDTFVAVDVLRRGDEGFEVIEVKSSTSAKETHVRDLAVQVHVLRRSGIDVRGASVMHLNRAHRHPGGGELFARTDVTEDVELYLPLVPDEIVRQKAMLVGARPNIRIGLHCSDPWACPFTERCWPDDPQHIRHLYNVGPKRTAAYMREGVHRIPDLPATEKLPPAARRQLRALREHRMIVEPGLARALRPFGDRLGFLDFETVNRAIPVWPGLGPWRAATAQFSYHEEQRDGSFTHAAYLAEGPDDPRPELAHRLIEATRGADRVVMYSAYERTCIRELQESVPELATPLRALEEKMIDLLPVLRDHVYHPAFRGSFSIKYVLNPLVPELTYDDLVIVDGLTASVEIARLLFVAHKIDPGERERIRSDLLDYCERDTWAMVRLLARLRELARETDGV